MTTTSAGYTNEGLIAVISLVALAFTPVFRLQLTATVAIICVL